MGCPQHCPDSFSFKLRAFWYIWMVILQEEDAQLRGVVVVAFELGDKPPKFDFELVRREMHMLKCVPMRIVGSHFCTGTQALLQTLDLILHMATPFFRVHARSHCGKCNRHTFKEA